MVQSNSQPSFFWSRPQYFSDVFPLRCVVADFFLCVALSLTLKNVAKPATAQVSSSTNVANPKSCEIQTMRAKSKRRRNRQASC